MQRVSRRVGELEVLGDVGGAAQLGLVPGDQHAVPGRDQVDLDVVDAHPDRRPVGLERVLGPVPAGAAVTHDRGRDDQTRGPVSNWHLPGHGHGATCLAYGRTSRRRR